MATETTLTVDLSPEVRSQLGRLAEVTAQPVSAVAADAIAHYVAHELRVIEGIDRGLADMRAGRVIPHDKAMERLEATVVRAERKAR